MFLTVSALLSDKRLVYVTGGGVDGPDEGGAGAMSPDAPLIDWARSPLSAAGQFTLAWVMPSFMSDGTTTLVGTPTFDVYHGTDEAQVRLGPAGSGTTVVSFDTVSAHANLAAFPGTGSGGTLYVALDTGLCYRWTGSAYAAPLVVTGLSPSTRYAIVTATLAGEESGPSITAEFTIT